MKVLLLSHGHLAVEMLNTAEMIMGDISGVQAIPLEPGEDIEKYGKIIQKTMKEASPDNLLIITDLLGGSPFMISMKQYNELENAHDHVRIVTGMNLPMILELINIKDNNMDIDELCDEMISAGTGGIHNFVKEREERK